MFARETEPTLVADGVVRFGTELVNWYLVEDGGKVTVVDAGMPRFRPQLERGLAELGQKPDDVEAMILAHAHSDHVGVAEPLRTELRVPVCVHEDDVIVFGHGDPWTHRAAEAVRVARETGST